MIRNN